MGLTAFDARETSLDNVFGCNGNGDVCARIQFTTSLAGDYFLRARPVDNNRAGTYSIRVLPRYDQGLTRGTDGEPNDALALAEPIRVGRTSALTRTIAPRTATFVTVAGDQDYYRFSGVPGTTYVAEIFNVAIGLEQWA